MFFDVSFGSIVIDEVDAKGNPVLDDAGKPKQKQISIPFLVAFLLCGAVFFTFWYGWINIRGFSHAVDIVRGKFSKSHHDGDVSHFRALTSALSATVGLGNIAGVAIAIQVGGPGAVF